MPMFVSILCVLVSGQNFLCFPTVFVFISQLYLFPTSMDFQSIDPINFQPYFMLLSVLIEVKYIFKTFLSLPLSPLNF